MLKCIKIILLQVIVIYAGKKLILATLSIKQSMILVDIQSPGVQVIRPFTVLGFDDAPHGHAEVYFENVCVPVKNVLLAEGGGFEIAQVN